MTTCTTHTLHGNAHITQETAGGWLTSLRGLWDAYWASRARATTVYALRGLDDRTLHDIGLERSEIESVVYARHGERLRGFVPGLK